MDIELKEITVRDLVAGYEDDGEGGVRGYGGKLDIRPPYQREFVYKDEQREAVIDTLTQGFPLNVMYWSVRDNDNFEIIDGQQRTISICQYVEGDFSYKGRFFHNLQDDEKEKILDYELMVYQCTGTDSERLAWFKTINIAGIKLTDQELRNAVYAGSWVSDAKRYFSKVSGPAHGKGSKYLSGEANRQEYLETVIKWMKDEESIEEYMAKCQHNESAEPLWEYFEQVIDWTEGTFTKYRREMKGLGWGLLYNEHKDKKLNSEELEKEIANLMEDEEIQRKKGIYEYLLTGKEKHLNLRSFDDKQKRIAYERQKGKCGECGEAFDISNMHADHIDPWSKGGKTEQKNCQMLCRDCNLAKSDK
ncbi:MAG: DUF262 domain-containing protein [Candidatus Mycalebacterium zealandia]|nr:MAG: DUF262 domain-containing protein [Candidatus Mycalebacterium zealandia]